MNDIIINMKPINYIINDKMDKKEDNTIEKKIIEDINNKEVENIFEFNICRKKYENEKNENIEIIFDSNNSNKQYDIFKNSLLNLNDLPQKQEITKIIDNESCEKIVNIPNRIYKKSILSKPFHEITKNY